jgi:hypothetical protein
MAGIGVVIAAVAVLFVAYGTARRILDRRRAAEWDKGWAAAEARWRGPKH